MARTVNLDVIALRHVLKLAVERGFIERLPEIRQLKQKPPQRRPMVTKEQFETLLAATTEETTKNAKLFRFCLRFLALAGAREKEALAVCWQDVDFKRATVTIGSGGMAKSHDAWDVDFSPELKSLLFEMAEARTPDTSWLFPSPQRGERDVHAKRLGDSLNSVRKKAGLPWFGFHDLRHSSASSAPTGLTDFGTSVRSRGAISWTSSVPACAVMMLFLLCGLQAVADDGGAASAMRPPVVWCVPHGAAVNHAPGESGTSEIGKSLRAHRIQRRIRWIWHASPISYNAVRTAVSPHTP